mgnify:CR=1 FL=1
MTLTRSNIEELIKLCKEGNQSAKLEVYNRYYKAMFNASLRIVQDSNDAEDVMQEAFLNAFTKLDTFKGEVPFGAWLKRIVINKNNIWNYIKPIFIPISQICANIKGYQFRQIQDNDKLGFYDLECDDKENFIME